MNIWRRHNRRLHQFENVWTLSQILNVPFHVDVRHALDDLRPHSQLAVLLGVVLASAYDANANDLTHSCLVEGPFSEVTSEEALRQLRHDFLPWQQKGKQVSPNSPRPLGPS